MTMLDEALKKKSPCSQASPALASREKNERIPCPNSISKFLRDALTSESEIVFAYLFGSHLTHEQTALSDIDVAVYPARKLTLDERLGVIQRLGKKTTYENLDITFLDRSENLDLLRTITTRGLVLADKNVDARELFEVRVQHEYFDFNEQRKKISGAVET